MKILSFLYQDYDRRKTDSFAMILRQFFFNANDLNKATLNDIFNAQFKKHKRKLEGLDRRFLFFISCGKQFFS
jgi:hypothetical protein